MDRSEERSRWISIDTLPIFCFSVFQRRVQEFVYNILNEVERNCLEGITLTFLQIIEKDMILE